MSSPANNVAPTQPIGHWFGKFAYALCCLITLALAIIGLARIFFFDHARLLIWLNAFTLYIYLPAYICLAWSVWRRRWALAVVNLAIVALHLTLIAPDFVRNDRIPAAANPAATSEPLPRTVRIFFANVRALNTEHDALLHEILAANPDVIILVEFSWLWHAAYLHSPYFAQFRFGRGMANETLDTVNVFSRLPILHEVQDTYANRIVDSIEIPLGVQSLHIIGLHGPRPMAIRDDDYEGFWRLVVPKLLAAEGPTVVVGDFNATQYSRIYQELTRVRYRSAHQDRGRGFATSWPNGYFWLPPIRIDQVLLSPDVECVDLRAGEGRGSDHKPQIIDIRIRPSST